MLAKGRSAPHMASIEKSKELLSALGIRAACETAVPRILCKKPWTLNALNVLSAFGVDLANVKNRRNGSKACTDEERAFLLLLANEMHIFWNNEAPFGTTIPKMFCGEDHNC